MTGVACIFCPSTSNSLCTPKSKLCPRSFSHFPFQTSSPCRRSVLCLSPSPHTPCMHPFSALLTASVARVAVVIRRDDGYAFHRVDIQADGRGVAVWFSLAGTPLLAVGLHPPASGPPEVYEPILQWALAHIPASARYLHVVFGDKPRVGTTLSSFFFRYARLFSDFLEEASLRQVPPPRRVAHMGGGAGIFQRFGPFPCFFASSPLAGGNPPRCAFPLRPLPHHLAHPQRGNTRAHNHPGASSALPPFPPASGTPHGQIQHSVRPHHGSASPATVSHQFQHIREALVEAAHTVYGELVAYDRLLAMVRQQQDSLKAFLLSHPFWWTRLEHLHQVLTLRRAVHTARCIATLESQLGLGRPHRHEQPSARSYRRVFGRQVGPSMEPKYVVSMSVNPRLRAHVTLDQLR